MVRLYYYEDCKHVVKIQDHFGNSIESYIEPGVCAKCWKERLIAGVGGPK